MIPLEKITGEKNPSAQTRYNRQIPLSKIIDTPLPQEEPKDSGGFFNTLGNAFDWWKGNSLAGAGYLGGLLSETAGNIYQGIGGQFDEGSLPRRALEGAGQISQSVADKLLDFGEKNFDVADESTAAGNLANQFMSGVTGSFGSLGRMIHSDKSADALRKASESTAEKNRVSTDDLGEYFTSSHGFLSDAANFVGQQVPTLPLLFAKPLPIIEAAVAKYGGNAITQGLINSGRYGAAKWFASETVILTLNTFTKDEKQPSGIIFVTYNQVKPFKKSGNSDALSFFNSVVS